MDKATAEQIVTTFMEAVIAPSFDEESLDILRTKKNDKMLLSDGDFPHNVVPVSFDRQKQFPRKKDLHQKHRWDSDW